MSLIYDFSNKRDGDMRQDENLRHFIESLGVGEAPFVRAEQVHGDGIARVGREHAGQVIPGVDVLITTAKRLFLVVLAADCLPIILFDRRRSIVGVCHAGWRGTAARLAAKTVEKFIQLGSRGSDLAAIFGPSICVRHYEVGDDVRRQFVGQDDAVFYGEGGKTYFDLRETNRRQLVGAGVPEGGIDIDPTCTFEDPYYFSYRRERPSLSGLFAGVVGIV